VLNAAEWQQHLAWQRIFFEMFYHCQSTNAPLDIHQFPPGDFDKIRAELRNQGLDNQLGRRVKVC
jgi:hypothetical protein